MKEDWTSIKSGKCSVGWLFLAKCPRSYTKSHQKRTKNELFDFGCFLMASYYKTRSVCGSVCAQTPLPFTGRPAPNLAGRSGTDTEKISRNPFPWKYSQFFKWQFFFWSSINKVTHWLTPRKGVHLFRYFLHSMRTLLWLCPPHAYMHFYCFVVYALSAVDQISCIH